MTEQTPDGYAVTSTADLTPNGILGYAKGIAAAVGAILVVLVPLLPLDGALVQWIQVGIAVCGVVAVIVIPNPVVPVRVVTGAP